MVAFGEPVGVIVALIFLGFFLRRSGFAQEQWTKVLDAFALYVAFPPLIILALSSMAKENVDMRIFFYNAFLLILILLGTHFALRCTKLPRDIRNCYTLSLSWGNVAFLGIPFISAVLPGSVGNVSIIIASYLVVLFTVGLWLVDRTDGKKKHVQLLHLLKNPLLLAVLIGGVLFFFQLSLHQSVKGVFKIVADTATPLALIGIGTFLARSLRWGKELFHGALIALLKLVVVPALFFVAHFFLFQSNSFTVVILEAGMPVGVVLFALTETHALNKRVIEYAIIISTALSLVTLPILATLLM